MGGIFTKEQKEQLPKKVMYRGFDVTDWDSKDYLFVSKKKIKEIKDKKEKDKK